MITLGIETSCDETAMAILGEGKCVLSHVVASQVEVHRPYGGVVPEIASRKHIEMIGPIFIQCLNEAGIAAEEISGIAVTRGPGLVGALLVGLSFAKALAFALGIPFVGVNHLHAHIASVFLSDDHPQFPFLALVVSGGHTALYIVRNFEQMEIVGQTRDDAAGEALDKGAKILGLGYPGGVIIDKLAKGGNPDAYAFPRAMKDSLDFSFSGLKTAIVELLRKKGGDVLPSELPDLVASYQEAVVDVLVDKTVRAAELYQMSEIVICGGVAANSRLREKFSAVKDKKVFLPPLELCTDNGAMVAFLGFCLLSQGASHPFELNALSRWP